jgi:antitoxin (DNA-binding transcriptional repressor) of toxin-antitoxin stability system
MTHLNVHEAKTHWSEWLAAVERGETIVLCRRNVPIAEVRPLPKPAREPRPIGTGLKEYGPFEISPAFFEPLPDDLLDLYEGREPGEPRP